MLQAACPGNVHLLRQKSAWSNIEVCKQVIRLVGAALRRLSHPPLVRRWQAVLLMDACRLHLHPSVIAACLAEGIWPIIVPAKMTWLLQPLDTHAFKPYKENLREAYQRARLRTATGELTIAQFVAALCGTIRHVLQGRRWASAFDRDGFGQQQALVSRTVLKRLQLQAPPAITAAAPSVQQLQLCYPKKAKVPAGVLLRPYQPRPQAAAAPPAAKRFAALPLAQPLLPRRPAPVVANRPGPVTRLAASLALGAAVPKRPVMRARRE